MKAFGYVTVAHCALVALLKTSSSQFCWSERCSHGLAQVKAAGPSAFVGGRAQQRRADASLTRAVVFKAREKEAAAVKMTSSNGNDGTLASSKNETVAAKKNAEEKSDINASDSTQVEETVIKDKSSEIPTKELSVEMDSEKGSGTGIAINGGSNKVSTAASEIDKGAGKSFKTTKDGAPLSIAEQMMSILGFASKPKSEREAKQPLNTANEGANAKITAANKDDKKSVENRFVPLTVAATLALIGGVYIHKDAWESFFSSLAEMNANSSPDEFAAALKFWLFAAVIHPILQPVFWISEVLHGTPGPKLAGLVPYTFLGETAIVVIVLSVEEIRKAMLIALFAAFVTYVGAGLDGHSPLIAGLKADYDIQLDDSYGGKAFKGCPAYSTIRQPSVDDFSLDKYAAGRWYWQKVHDWTQFKEVYDTTLDIKQTPDGKGYINNLGIKGPSPKSNPLSWNKSPLANGAHYFWSGKIDENDPPGMSREKAFGVEFPNYIVDIKTDPETGEYEELIQFQCIEVGGVRLYEGIDFMSRSPGMSDSELKAMHARAEKAGLNPYGASPDQMHRIERADGAVVDNPWQDLWKKVGFDTLLDKLAVALENGASS